MATAYFTGPHRQAALIPTHRRQFHGRNWAPSFHRRAVAVPACPPTGVTYEVRALWPMNSQVAPSGINLDGRRLWARFSTHEHNRVVKEYAQRCLDAFHIWRAVGVKRHIQGRTLILAAKLPLHKTPATHANPSLNWQEPRVPAELNRYSPPQQTERYPRCSCQTLCQGVAAAFSLAFSSSARCFGSNIAKGLTPCGPSVR